MFSSFLKVVQANQPVSTTGALLHTYYWLTTFMSGDIVYHNPNFKAPETDDPSLCKGVAIYCVHGTADQPGSFERIAERLIEKGLPDYISSIHLVAFDNRYQGKGIKYFSRELMKKVQANGHEHVIFMGHSRGGVIISHAAEYRAARMGIKVHSLFPICAPFGGSYWAMKPLSMFSTSVAQMEINTDLLIRLNQIISTTSNIYHFIGAAADSIVSPIAAYVADYVEKHSGSKLTLDRHGHLSIMSSRRLVDYIHDALVELGKTLGLENIAINDISAKKEEGLKESNAPLESSKGSQTEVPSSASAQEEKTQELENELTEADFYPI